MKNGLRFDRKLRDQQGVSAVLAGLLMVVFIGFAALAVDLFHLFVVRNELQNAADAGALAGARVLYNENLVNEGANHAAYDASIANKSEKAAVDVKWPGGNNGDVQRGHWSFSTKTFTPNPLLDAVNLQGVSNEDLDANPDFINAVRVRARRLDTPAASFFARIFAYENFILSAEAVAYIGFAGQLYPQEVDQPIAICKQALTDESGRYYCRARMINSGPGITSQTAGWSNFEQGGTACSGAAGASTVKPLVCGNGNPATIQLGQQMTTNGGEIQSAFNALVDCWKANPSLQQDTDGWPDLPWLLTLPVIDCGDGNPGPCNRVTGAVDVSILWITGSGEQASNGYKNTPRRMYGWTCPPGSTNEQCWKSFTQHFNIKDENNAPFPYMQKTIYFQPDCRYHEPAGRTGGENFGVFAKIPVLVK